jgi:lysophospholipase L1-like esterase
MEVLSQPVNPVKVWSMPTAKDPIAIGQKKAHEILVLRKAARARRAAALAARPEHALLKTASGDQTAGFLIAAGDSWFDYPFHDVLKQLDDDHGYNIESAAHRGDPIESMAYQGGQLDKLARCLEKVKAHGATPKAVLISGGGDDIAGQEFGMLLNNESSEIAGWNDEVVDGVLNRRIVSAYRTMLAFVNQLCQQELGKVLPVLVHGYDYPVPDGRGFWGGWPFPGPWLEPGFREKLFDDLANNAALMHTIMDRFNAMVAGLTQEFANLHYVDLRGTLSTDLNNDAYQDWWDNELHPTEKGFQAVANKFAAVLAAL